MKPRPRLLAGEDLLPEPSQARSREKRARLKTAGLSLFGEKGFEKTSVDEIAVRAGLAVGSFYQHFRSKRQLLLVLMDELLDRLSRLDLRPRAQSNIRAGLQQLLATAFSHDLKYLGAYRAWSEASLTDADLARKQRRILNWTTSRATAALERLQQMPGARTGVDVPGLARAMDSFFWSLLAQAPQLSKARIVRSVAAATHLIYHALFKDSA